MRASAFGVLSLLLLLSFGCSRDSSGEASTSGASEAGFGLSAEQVYARRCASCHGPAGKGDGPLSRNYSRVGDLSGAVVQAYSDAELEDIMRKGIRRMPPVRNLINPEVELLVGYVRVLGGNAPAEAPADAPAADDAPAAAPAGE